MFFCLFFLILKDVTRENFRQFIDSLKKRLSFENTKLENIWNLLN
jgi:hypothetical protein